ICTNSTLAQHLESPLAIAAITVDGEVVIKARDLGDTKSLHDNKAGAINNGEGLVGKWFADGPSGLQIGSSHLFQFDVPTPNSQPELFRGVPMDTGVNQIPRFDQDVIS